MNTADVMTRHQEAAAHMGTKTLKLKGTAAQKKFALAIAAKVFPVIAMSPRHCGGDLYKKLNGKSAVEQIDLLVAEWNGKEAGALIDRYKADFYETDDDWVAELAERTAKFMRRQAA